VFEKPEDTPPGGFEGLVVGPVALDVPRELRRPIVAVRARRLPVLRAPVPEAPIDEYGDAHSGENDVRSDPPMTDWDAKIFPKTKTEPMKLRP
jgi:hypothetical protein